MAGGTTRRCTWRGHRPMFQSKKNDMLLAAIRNGGALATTDKLSLIVGLSLPSMLAQITSVLMFFIDAAMVGHLGADASASIGLVESSTWLFGSFTSATSMGFAVQVAHFIGANDFGQARRVFCHSIVCAELLSIVVMLVGVAIAFPLPVWLGGTASINHDASLYFLIFALVIPINQMGNLSGAMLKSTGNMRVPSIVSILMCLLDVVFNALFIYALRLGVVGAALGTACAILVGASLQFYYVAFRNEFLAFRLDGSKFRWVGSYVRNAVKIGAPMAFQSTLMGGAQMVSTMIVAPLGTIAIAANSFAITAESLCYMPGYGLGDAATTLVGQSRGANRLDLTRSFAHMAVALGMMVMAVMGVVMYVFAPEMIGVLSPVEAIRELGTRCLRIEAFAEPFFAASIVCNCIFIGAGDTLRPAFMNLGSMWFIRLTLAAVMAPRYGLAGVWVAMAAELTLRGCIFLARLLRGKWLKGFGAEAAASAG